MKRNLTEAEIKKKQRKRKIRKRRFSIFLLILLFVSVGTFYYFLKTKLFPIKKIGVSGSEIYSSQEVIKASGITGKTPIMRYTESSLTKKLQKKLPYIESVKIKRTFPDTMVITVSDAKETFAYKTDEGYFSVSDNLRVLALKKQRTKDLIEVITEEPKLKIGESVKFADDEEAELFKLLYSHTREKKIKLNRIDITSRVHITLFVEDKFEVNLGQNENIEQKIDHLSGMIKEIGNREGNINLEMWSDSDSEGTFIPKK